MGILLILYYVVSVVLKVYWCSTCEWLELESDVELLYFRNVTLAYDDDWNYPHKMVKKMKISFDGWMQKVKSGN